MTRWVDGIGKAHGAKLDIQPGHKFGALKVLNEEPEKAYGKRYVRQFRVQCIHGFTHVFCLFQLQNGVNCFCGRHATEDFDGLTKIIPWFIILGLQHKLLTPKQVKIICNLDDSAIEQLKKKGKNVKSNTCI